MFECKQKNSYGIEKRNDMTFTHDKEVNKVSECNLQHDIINPNKRAKNLNSHYSPIIHQCMNNIRGREKFKNFQIISDSGRISAIVMGRLVEKLSILKDSVMK